MLTELERLAANVDKEPQMVGRRAAELLAEARRRDDAVAAAMAATLVARARRDVREIEAAELAIDEAIALAEPVGGDVLADAHMVAASIANHRRGPAAVAEHLHIAARNASPALAWKVGVQQAVLAFCEGRLDDSLHSYDAVIPALRTSGNHVVLARVLSNRGLVGVLRGDLAGAIRDYDEARALFADEGQDFAVAIVMQNTAEAIAHTGDIAAALELHDRAAERLEELGQPMHDALIWKADALISVGLFDDAVELLGRASDALAADGDRAGAATAMLAGAEARRLAGDAAAAEMARRAHEAFVELGLSGLAAQAELELLRAVVAQGDAGPGDLDAAQRLVESLESSGQVRASIEASSLAATIAVGSGRIELAEQLARRATRRASRLPFVEHRLAAVHATALVDAASGRHDDALADIQHVLDDFDVYRATIGTPDGRRASALHAAELVQLGAELVATTGSETDILAWSERRRVAERQTGPAPAADRRLASMVGELRSIIEELRQLEGGESPSSRPEDVLVDRRTELERAVREHLVRTRTSSAPAEATGDRATALVARTAGLEQTLVSIDAHGDRLVGVVVHAGGCRRVELGTVRSVVRIADSARSLLSAAAGDVTSGPRRRSLDQRLHAALAEFDRVAVAPLAVPAGPVVLAVPDALHAAPWSASPSLVDRDVTMAVALSSWLDARGDDTPTSAAPRLAAIPGPRLEFAHTELESVVKHYGGHAVVVGQDGTADEVASAFSEADVVHVAAHARLRPDNPLWSTIEVVGGPMFVHRLLDGVGAPPSLVVLSTCESAVPSGPPGASLSGFASALVDGGVDSVIATIARLPDTAATVSVMSELHRYVAAGMRPSIALTAVRRSHPGVVAASVLTCWGRG